MAVIITQAIAPQSFEVIRDRLGRILAEELPNQATLLLQDDLNANVWMERFIPIDKTELPSVIVTLAEGNYDGQTVVQNDGTYRYNIDVHMNSKANVLERGDTKSMTRLHRLLGVVRSILMDSKYKTLGFAPPFIMNRHIESLQIQNPNQKEHDGDHTVMGRLVMSVKAPETGSEVPISTMQESDTSVSLDSTDKGYKWVRLNDVSYYNFDYALDY